MNIRALFNLSYGLYVIGTKEDDKNIGCVVNTVFQVTSSPSTIAVSINKDNYTNACIKASNKFSVSILSQNIEPSVIGTFGFASSRDVNKFEGLNWQNTPNGMPYLKDGVTSYLQCKVINSLDCFTHTVFIAEIEEAENISNEQAMTYEYYHRVIKGKAPKTAPTYVDESKLDIKPEHKTSYVCSVCKYVYEGSKEEFEKLPDDYRCPICKVPKSKFEEK